MEENKCKNCIRPSKSRSYWRRKSKVLKIKFSDASSKSWVPLITQMREEVVLSCSKCKKPVDLGKYEWYFCQSILIHIFIIIANSNIYLYVPSTLKCLIRRFYYKFLLIPEPITAFHPHFQYFLKEHWQLINWPISAH